MDQVRSSSFSFSLDTGVQTQASSQGTNCARTFAGGSLRRIRLLTTILPVVPITRKHLSGFSVGVSSPNGSPMRHSCGSTENVRSLTFLVRRTLMPTSYSGLREEHTLVCPYQTQSSFVTYLWVSSTIIQDIVALRDNGLASMAYFYFDFRDVDKQNRCDLLPSLIIQLSNQSHRHCDILNDLYHKHQSGTQKPSEVELIQCLKDMLVLPNQQPVYIIVDALDESPDTSGLPSPRERVLDLVKQLVELSSPNLHLCVTSRPEIDILKALEPLTSCRVSLHEQSGQRQDIIDYVTSVVHSDPKMQRWRDEDKKLVIETLSAGANGM